MEDYSYWTKCELERENYDYVIGSLHELIIKNESYAIEPGFDDWIKQVEKLGGIKKFVMEYYKQIKLMIKSKLFDSIGHLDYVRIYNNSEELFSESSWYKKEVLECLDLIKENNLVLEINHGGIRKTTEQFPRSWIINEAKKRNISITLGLDGHWEKHYNNEDLEELVNIAKKAGYTEVVRFEKRKRIVEKI